MTIQEGDIVDVRQGANALVTGAKVLHVPIATGDAWGFRKEGSEFEVWTTEGITIWKRNQP